MDISDAIPRILEAVQIACYDITDAVKKQQADTTPTPFQRAVIGGLVLIAQHADTSGERNHFGFNDQQLSAAHRAIAPFLDETL